MRNPFRNLALLFCLGATACNGTGDTAGPGANTVLPDVSQTDPSNPGAGGRSGYVTDVLLFNGTGVSTSDWQSTEQIIQDHGWSYQLVNSAQLNAMSLDEIGSFGAIVVPGGSGGSIAGGITSAAQLRLRQAVRDRGVGYVGFCAGAWVAVGPESSGDSVAGYGFAVAPGNVLDAFYPGGNTSLTAAMVPVSLPDGSSRQLVWWGGPSTPEWAGGVIGRYDDGTPAISETLSGKGFVVISGPHPEAPQGWRATAGNDSDGLDYDLAIAMIDSAITRKPMKAF